MQKIAQMVTIIIGLSTCTAPNILAKNETRNIEYAIKTVLASAVTAVGGYGLLQYLPNAITNGHDVHDYVTLGKALTREEHTALIQNSLKNFLASGFALYIVVKFGSIALHNLGKTIS